MARRGENIRKRSDGRWEGRYLCYRNGCKQYRSVYGHTYHEVKEKLLISRQQSADKQELMIKGTNLCVDELARLWLSDVQKNRKHATYIKYEGIYVKYIKSYIGSLTVRELSPERLIAELPIGADKSVSLEKSICCVTNQLLAYGNQHYGMREIHIRSASRPSVTRPFQTLNQSEQHKLRCYLIENLDIYKLGILICLYMGLRLGEICALRWEDIDFECRTLHVNRTVQRIRTGQEETKTSLYLCQPKTLCSMREIPIPEFLYSLLLLYRRDSAYVINQNQPMEPRTYQYKFQSYLKNAGICSYHFHALRHTFATNCISSGADAKSVSEMLGHSNVNITLNRYVHPSMDTKRNILDALTS